MNVIFTVTAHGRRGRVAVVIGDIQLSFGFVVRNEGLIFGEGRQTLLALVLSGSTISLGLDRIKSHLIVERRACGIGWDPPTSVGRGHITRTAADAATTEAVEAPSEE
jgi:hypothetical protein